MLLLPKAPMCLAALTTCVLCCGVLWCCVWQWLKALLVSSGDQGYHRLRQCCTFCKVLLTLHIPQCRYSWILEEYFAWDLTVFISEYSEHIEFLETSFCFWTVSSFPLSKQISIASYPSLPTSCIGGLSSSFRANIYCVGYFMVFLMSCGS